MVAAGAYSGVAALYALDSAELLFLLQGHRGGITQVRCTLFRRDSPKTCNIIGQCLICQEETSGRSVDAEYTLLARLYKGALVDSVSSPAAFGHCYITRQPARQCPGPSTMHLSVMRIAICVAVVQSQADLSNVLGNRELPKGLDMACSSM